MTGSSHVTSSFFLYPFGPKLRVRMVKVHHIGTLFSVFEKLRGKDKVNSHILFGGV